jgi:2-C-methyl-D-erythritol 2,4-cyclodiphosphate synthase
VSETFRLGIGWDQHRLVEGRPLILGGERFDHPRGLEGHSDADVLVHAVCDALLGALGMGDLGRHFPDDDPRHQGADSLGFLARVAEEMAGRGYRVGNLDTVIVAQEPRLGGRLDAMRDSLARILGCGPEAVNVKASSPEGIGGLGQAQGITAHAVVLLVGTAGRTE